MSKLRPFLVCPKCYHWFTSLVGHGCCEHCGAPLASEYVAIEKDGTWVKHSTNEEERREVIRRSLGPSPRLIMIYQVEWKQGGSDGHPEWQLPERKLLEQEHPEDGKEAA